MFQLEQEQESLVFVDERKMKLNQTTKLLCIVINFTSCDRMDRSLSRNRDSAICSNASWCLTETSQLKPKQLTSCPTRRDVSQHASEPPADIRSYTREGDCYHPTLTSLSAGLAAVLATLSTRIFVLGVDSSHQFRARLCPLRSRGQRLQTRENKSRVFVCCCPTTAH